MKHAVVAFATLHELLVRESRTNSSDGSINVPVRRHFAIEQANKSIWRTKDRQHNNDDITPVLVVCILLVSFQMLLGEWASAAGHLESGMSLIESWLNETPTGGKNSREFVVDVLLPTVWRLNLHFNPVRDDGALLEGCMTCVRLGNSSITLFRALSTSYETHSMNFSSLEKANLSFERLIIAFLDDCSKQGASMKHDQEIHDALRQVYLNNLSVWFHHFQLFLEEGTMRHTTGYGEVVAFLYVQYFNARIFLYSIASMNETVFDRCTEDFEQVNAWSFKYIQALKLSPSAKYRISFSLRIIFPLRNVASCCREPSIRRRAVELLRMYDSHEGPWSSRVTADIISQLIYLEESSSSVGTGSAKSCKDISKDRRVRLLRRTILSREEAKHGETTQVHEYRATDRGPEISLFEYTKGLYTNGLEVEVQKMVLKNGNLETDALLDNINGVSDP